MAHWIASMAKQMLLVRINGSVENAQGATSSAAVEGIGCYRLNWIA